MGPFTLLAVLIGIGGISMQSAAAVFIRDSFSGPNGTTLSNHAPEVGQGWRSSASEFRQLILTGNRLGSRYDTDHLFDYAVSLTPAPSAEYAVIQTVSFNRTLGAGSCLPGWSDCRDGALVLVGCADLAGGTGYVARLSAGGQVSLFRAANGRVDLLGSGAVPPAQFSLYPDHTLVLSMRNSVKEVYLDARSCCNPARRDSFPISRGSWKTPASETG